MLEILFFLDETHSAQNDKYPVKIEWTEHHGGNEAVKFAQSTRAKESVLSSCS